MSERFVYMGVDPGLTGALAWYDPEYDLIEVADMPVHQIKTGRGIQREIDYHSLARLVAERAHLVKMCAIERVSAMPKQGLSSTFKFGMTYGAALSALACNIVPFTEVFPNKWKPSMGVTSDKTSSRMRASRLFPGSAHKFERVKDDGKAEAALLAVYAKQYWDRFEVR